LKVVFSDGFELQSKRLGVSKEAVLDLLNNADKVQEQAHNGLLVRFFLKREPQAYSYLLLIAQVKESTIHPDLILRVLSDLYLDIGLLEPVMVVQLLAQRYGMILRIGRRLARFYYQEEIALEGKQDAARIVQVVDETGHDCLASFYVGVFETSSGRVVKCALAFCIDRSLYESWLCHPPARPKTEDPRDRSITRIIPLQRAREIQASCIDEPNPRERLYKIELRLSIEIITKLMGDTWYRTVYEDLPKVFGEEDPRLLNHYKRITGLGHFLNQLWRDDESNNLSDKIDELRGTSFELTYFELKIAAHFDRRGFDPTFLKRKKVRVDGKEEWMKTPRFPSQGTRHLLVCRVQEEVFAGSQHRQ